MYNAEVVHKHRTFIEAQATAFAMYADEHGLGLDDGIDLAEAIWTQMDDYANDRAQFLGEAHEDASV